MVLDKPNSKSMLKLLYYVVLIDPIEARSVHALLGNMHIYLLHMRLFRLGWCALYALSTSSRRNELCIAKNKFKTLIKRRARLHNFACFYVRQITLICKLNKILAR